MSDKWIVVNLTTKSFTVGIPGTPSLTNGSSFDLLLYTDKTTACTNARLRDLIANQQVIVKKYSNDTLVATIDHTNYVSSFCDAPPVPVDDPVTQEDLAEKADKVSGADDGNFASLTGTGNLADSGYNATSFAEPEHTHVIGDVDGLQSAIDAKVDPATLAEHTEDTNNPHEVTAAQTGAYSTAQTDTLLADKEDKDHCHEIGDVKGLIDALANTGVGQSGFSGYSGTSGYSGIGISGFSGYSGEAGSNGISGFSGISGYSGVGISGYSGTSGVSAPFYTYAFDIADNITVGTEIGWTLDGEKYTYTFQHMLTSTNVNATVWNNSGELQFTLVKQVDSDTLQIAVSSLPDNRFTGFIVINGGGQQGYSGISGYSGSSSDLAQDYSFTNPVVPNLDLGRVLDITATGSATIGEPTGTITDGMFMTLRFLLNGAYTMTFDTNYYDFGTDITQAMMPNTNNAKFEVGCRYHESDDRWRVVALVRGF